MYAFYLSYLFPCASYGRVSHLLRNEAARDAFDSEHNRTAANQATQLLHHSASCGRSNLVSFQKDRLAIRVCIRILSSFDW
jgi:hypothetical protein